MTEKHTLNWRAHIEALIMAGDLVQARQALVQAAQVCAARGPHATMDVMWLQSRQFMVQPGWNNILHGQGVRLRTPCVEDASFLLAVFGNPVFMRQFHRMSTRVWTLPMLRQYLASYRQDIAGDKSRYWVVEALVPDSQGLPLARAVGLASLAEVQIAHLRAEFLIGFPKPVSSVLAFRASVLLIEHAFLNLGLQKLTSVVFADNTLAQQSTLAIGFAQEGYRVQHLRDPRTLDFIDCHENGLTREAYLAHGRMARVKARVESRQGKADNSQHSPQGQSGVL